MPGPDDESAILRRLQTGEIVGVSSWGGDDSMDVPTSPTDNWAIWLVVGVLGALGLVLSTFGVKQDGS